jgi:hypothetical protein
LEGRRFSERASQGPREDTPDLSRALARNSFVAVSAKVGNDVAGFVCDRDTSGLLLDVRDPSGDPVGYQFLPWSSIERVTIGM